MRGSGAVGTDQHPPTRPVARHLAWKLRQRLLRHRDVVDGGVRPRVPRAQHQVQRLTRTLLAVVDERAQRMEPESAFERRTGVLLLRVRPYQRRVEVHGQRRSGVGLVVRGVLAGESPHPSPRCRAGLLDRGQHPVRVRREHADGARHRRVGGDPAEHARLRTQQRHIGQAVPTERQRHREVEQHLGRVVGRQRLAPPPQTRRQSSVQTAGPHRLGQQHPTGLTHRAGAARVDADPWVEPGNVLHLKGAP